LYSSSIGLEKGVIMVGKIEVLKVVEHENGSATVVFDCDDESRKALINEGLLSLITKAVDKNNEEYDWHTEGKELTDERENVRST
jgi:hypothetical protein